LNNWRSGARSTAWFKRSLDRRISERRLSGIDGQDDTGQPSAVDHFASTGCGRRRSPVTGGFLDGVNVASLALMSVVTFQLGWAAIVDVPTVLLAVISAVLLLRYRVNSAWLVLGGAAIGLARAVLLAR